jgi:dynactin complex subunit
MCTAPPLMQTKGGFRAGIICDAVDSGINNGTVGGHRYFTCKEGQGLLVSEPLAIALSLSLSRVVMDGQDTS